MEKTVSLEHLWQIFKNTWWKILIVVLVITTAAGVITEFCIPRKYSSTTDFYIVNVNQTIDYTTSSTLGADQLLAENYIEVIKSDAMMSMIAEKLKTNHELEMTNKQIRSMISASTNNNASIFSITVTAGNPKLAYKVASYITELAPDLVTKITKPGEITATVSIGTIAATLNDKDPLTYGALAEAMQNAADQLKENGDSLTVKGIQNRLECIQVLRDPVENPNHISPDFTKVCILVALASALLTYAFFFLRDFLSSEIRTENDIKALTDLPILGVIPRWDLSSHKASNAYEYGYKGGNK